MRFRESFSLYRRRVPSGKIVFYYRSYDENGGRICGHSTGQTTKTAAREYCNRLNRAGKLKYEKKGGDAIPLFREFAVGWWDYESCPYLKSRKGRRPISKGYASQGQYAVKNHLLPAFGEKRIDRISEHDVDSWLTNFTSRGYTRKDGETPKKYKTNTGNLAFKILKIMLGHAVKQRLISVNPCKRIEMLKTDDEKEIKILTPDEVRKLFPEQWEAIWDERIFYVLNKLAACTGMRHGELLGLRGEFVYESYIDVCAQYNHHGYGDVKTHKPRNIPIPSGLRRDLALLMQDNGEGYLFSRDGGKNPVSRGYVYKSLYEALARIGIDEDARKARNLSMHGWRHFFNTTLLMANVSDSKVMSLTGHTTKKMKKHYTHFDNTRMADVIEVQENLLLPEPGRPDENSESENEKQLDEKKEPGEVWKRGWRRRNSEEG
jgi:integrase